MKRKMWLRLLAIALGVVFLAVMSAGSFAQDDAAAEDAAAEAMVVEEALTAETVQTNLNQIWLLVAGFMVFFMQAGFAMLEGGFIRAQGVVNSMAENFMDAAVTGIVFFLVGYGIAYAGYDAEAGIGSAIFTMPEIALGGINGTMAGDGFTFIDFFFQFAFAGAAATIATGAMAERTDFRGKLIYSAILGVFIYPVVVFWTWGGGWLAERGFLDFAGSTIVHQTGGIVALVGAIIVGPRVGRIFGKAPAPSNLMLATLGTFVLWFGWYGFNVGSTLEATDPNALGLVAVNTTLAASAGSLGALLFVFFTQGGKWDLGFILNGSLAGLVGITAGCAFVSPVAALIIGLTAGVVVVLTVSIVESARIDDAVGAFAVHGACGMLGSLAIGFWGLPELTGTAGGLLVGGGLDLLITQAIGVIAVAIWVTVASVVMFGVLRAAGLLRMPAAGNEIGIDAYEHGASVMPDLIPLPGDAIAGSDRL
jgi:ammonium transporter, Amt family